MGREPTSLLDYFHLHGEVPAYHLSYNIAPSQQAPVILHDDRAQRVCRLMRWGLIPAWSRGPDARFSMINARAETLEQKPAYKNAFRQRRCLIPCDGFYEWHQQATGKQPYYITSRSGAPLVMAGVWERWQSAQAEDAEVIESFSIITTGANQMMQAIHDRMPVIVDPARIDDWLGNGRMSPVQLHTMLQPREREELTLYAVSNLVNSPRNDSVELTAPLA